MDKEQIQSEIRRTAKANGGLPLGWRRFERETGIRYQDWYGKFWTSWGDAVREAGFEPNQFTEGFDDSFLLQKLVMLTRSLGHVPIEGEILLARRKDSAFPSEKTFRRFGSKFQRASRVIEYCDANSGNDDVACLWRQVAPRKQLPEGEEPDPSAPAVGYVYLLRHGARREYKIGRTNNPLRREGEVGIELPEKIRPLHYIRTDDPAGIESYWHTRFASKRIKNEWFALTAEDVRAFKRWIRIS